MSRVSELERLREQVKVLMDENERLKVENIRMSNTIDKLYDEVVTYVRRDKQC